MGSYLDVGDVEVNLVSPDRETSYRVDTFYSLRCQHGKQPWGPLRMEIAPDEPWLTNPGAYSGSGGAFALLDGWEFWSIDVTLQGGGLLDPLWSGPIQGTRWINAGGLGRWEIEAESFLGHFLMRFNNATSTAADVAYSGGTDYAADIILKAVRGAMGPSGTTPTGYPAITRTSVGPHWAVTGASTVSVGSQLTLSEQSGNNLITFVEHVADKGDVAVTISETAAGVWEIDVEAYQAKDMTAQTYDFRMTPEDGSVVSLERYNHLHDLLNVINIKGSGSGASQVTKWTHDGTSHTARGTYEGQGTIKGAASATVVGSEASDMVNDLKDPHDELALEVADRDGLEFNSKWPPRSLVPYADPEVGLSGSALVVGWELEGPSPWTIRPLVSDREHAILEQSAKRTGRRGRFGAASRWTSVDG